MAAVYIGTKSREATHDHIEVLRFDRSRLWLVAPRFLPETKCPRRPRADVLPLPFRGDGGVPLGLASLPSSTRRQGRPTRDPTATHCPTSRVQPDGDRVSNSRPMTSPRRS